VCDLETSRMGAPYIYDISHLRVNYSFNGVTLRLCACRRRETFECYAILPGD
jgi:hypothetical protein